jgi:hypothetical protein
MTQQSTSRSSRRRSASEIHPAVAATAIIAELGALAVAWLLPAVSEFTLFGDNVSELALGHYGALQTAAFVVSGIGALAIAWLLRRSTHGSRGSLLGSVLIGGYGLGAFVMVAFPTDRIDEPADVWRMSPTGLVHVSVAAVSFLSILIAMSVLTRTFARHPDWRAVTPIIVLFPIATLGLMLLQGEGPLGGLWQRLLLSVITAWLVTVAAWAGARAR